MNKREWLLAATALSAALATASAEAQTPRPAQAPRPALPPAQAQAPQPGQAQQLQPGQIGTAGAVNPNARSIPPGAATRMLFVGSGLFQNERINTDGGGQAHLLFADQSALTVGPNAEVTLDRFVYDPARDTGSLTLQAGRGVLRFVGGRVSKTGDVTVRTPAGTIGIRGGIAIIQVAADGSVFVAFLFGDYLDVNGYRLSRVGFGMRIGDAAPRQLTQAEMAGLLGALQGGTGLPAVQRVTVENGQFPPWLAPDWLTQMVNGFGGPQTGDWRGLNFHRFDNITQEGNNQQTRSNLHPPLPPLPPPPPPYIPPRPPPLPPSPPPYL